MSDNAEDSQEYTEAEESLNDHDGLVNALYEMAISSVYGDGFCAFGKDAEAYIKDIRFCGKEWLMQRCEARIKKEGY